MTRQTRKPVDYQEPPTQLPSKLFTIQDTAVYLGVGRTRVFQLIAQGLPVIRVDRMVRIDPGDLARWLQQHKSE